jgi:hypothetical protein
VFWYRAVVDWTAVRSEVRVTILRCFPRRVAMRSWFLQRGYLEPSWNVAPEGAHVVVPVW